MSPDRRQGKSHEPGALPLPPLKGGFAESTGVPDLPRGLVQTG